MHDKPVSLKSGFPRRASRVTEELSRGQVEGIRDAAMHASRIGLPFNRHLTLKLTGSGICDEQCSEAVGWFLRLFRDWLAKKGHSTAYVWVREHGPFTGAHVHILLHLPDGARLGRMTRRWVERVSGEPYRAGAVKTRSISRAAYRENLQKVVAYLCKGASEDAAAATGLNRRSVTGQVLGKRAGWSQNIGEAARRRWLLAH